MTRRELARLLADDRGLASGTIIFVAMLVAAALMFIAFNEPATDIFAVSGNYTTDSAAQDHIDLMEQIWDGVLVFIVFIAGLFVIARAVIEGRRP